MVQWLGLCAFTAEGLRSNPGGETKIPQASRTTIRINTAFFLSSLVQFNLKKFFRLVYTYYIFRLVVYIYYRQK